MIGRDGETIRFAPTWRKPVVLLVDGGTRSGKEILAFAFQEYGIGPVVGSVTAGAVVGGSPFLLSDGSLLFLATMDSTVNGTRLEGIGVTPDVEVKLDLPYAAGADPQLESAVNILLETIEKSQ